MTGHAPLALVDAVREQVARGVTTMLPTEDAAVVAEELARALRLGALAVHPHRDRCQPRCAADRPSDHGPAEVLVFSYCYHGSVDEAFAVATPDGGTVAREGNVGPPVDVAETTRAVEFNDVDALAGALAHGDVACVLAEPAMTNMGIVLPREGYHDALRALTREHGTLLVIDETHTFSAGPGGCTGAWGLEPDLVTIGKAIGGGVPSGALGLSDATAAAMLAQPDADYEDTGGVGGTLAGNALSVAAMRATLEHVLTDEAFARMIALAARFRRRTCARCSRTRSALERDPARLPRRVPLRARAGRQRDEAHAAADPELERYLHLHALNRGVLLTPFHNMALMGPTTTEADVARHTAVFGEAVDALLA